MNRYLLLSLVAFSIITISLRAQSKLEITRSGIYYYGEATAEQEQEACDRALKNLTEQIAVRISSFNEREIVDKSGNIDDVFRSITKTYSQATLSNVQYLKRQTEAGIEVFAYITKSAVGKIFEERKRLICNIFDKGKQFQEEENITDALKYFYFATILMNSVPEKSIMHGSLNLVIEIPAHINAIINGTKFTVTADRRINDKEREIEMRIEESTKPVRQTDFSFWDGNSQVNVRAVDGIGVFRLFGASAAFDQLNIEVKYKFYESREEISEVAELWDMVMKPSFKNNRTVPLRISSMAGAAPKPSTDSIAEPKLTFINKDSTLVAKKIESGSLNLLSILNKNSAAAIMSAYGNDKFLADKLQRILKYNRIQSTAGMANTEIHKTLTGWEVRPIRVLCSYPSLNRQSSEYLIVDFTNAGVLEDVNFGTLESIYSQFVEQGLQSDDWGNRQVIVKFIERYRTAYMTRNMAMLDSLFADEAVIIVGRELKRGVKRDDIQYTKLNESQPDFSYTQYTKKEYLKNQRKVFQSQNDISLGFSSFKIFRKNDTDGTYGISMKQNYTSTSYADEGHLFLLVDFQQAQPQIYVRSWQPREWNDDAMIKLSNFRVNK
jgi:hypothetical protein